MKTWQWFQFSRKKIIGSDCKPRIHTNGHEFLIGPQNTRKKWNASQTSADNRRRRCIWLMSIALSF